MDKAVEKQIKDFMAEKIADGISLSEIQSMVNAEFNLSMTYMDIRILASELEIDWQKLSPEKKASVPEEKSAPVQEEASADAAAPAGQEEPALPDDMPDLSTTKVEVSKLARPGMMFSGSAVFANGSTADWYLDNMGRLGVDNLQGDKPSQEDIEKFQIVLQNELRKIMGR